MLLHRESRRGESKEFPESLAMGKSRSGLEVLPEVITALKEEGVRDKVSVWVDGGVRRGTGVSKRYMCCTSLGRT